MPPDVQAKTARMTNPVFRMVKSLYGHPSAGKCWEDHLVGILKQQGWEPIPGMKSCFFNYRAGSKLGPVFLCVYVDDFIMSGKSLKPLWDQLLTQIKFGEAPQPIDRFLGVKHTITKRDGVMTCEFDMSDFAKSCVQRYCVLSKRDKDKLPKADTPSFREVPVFADNDEPGNYASLAPSLLMKPLYLARCARPELSFTIAKLARRITRWTRADDRAIDRMYAYINATAKFVLTGSLKIGCAETIVLKDFPDADLAGDAETARSTSGMWLELCDGFGHSFPVEWSSKLQTVVSHSTPEAELVSMSRSMREFALPIQGMWTLLLGRSVILEVHEDNTSTIEILKKGYSSKLSHLSRTHRISLAWTAEQVADEFVNLLHCPTALQKGDLFTKALDRLKHNEALDSIGMRKALVAAISRSSPPNQLNNHSPAVISLLLAMLGHR